MIADCHALKYIEYCGWYQTVCEGVVVGVCNQRVTLDNAREVTIKPLTTHYSTVCSITHTHTHTLTHSQCSHTPPFFSPPPLSLSLFLVSKPGSVLFRPQLSHLSRYPFGVSYHNRLSPYTMVGETFPWSLLVISSVTLTLNVVGSVSVDNGVIVILASCNSSSVEEPNLTLF